jgi:hypothetical protein
VLIWKAGGLHCNRPTCGNCCRRNADCLQIRAREQEKVKFSRFLYTFFMPRTGSFATLLNAS